ncbi:MAG: hypothetical protein K2H45_03835, partial [Acetatifactor sp.]|nr:hypothetical protein [Acetatifactor sp.]
PIYNQNALTKRVHVPRLSREHPRRRLWLRGMEREVCGRWLPSSAPNLGMAAGYSRQQPGQAATGSACYSG